MEVLVDDEAVVVVLHAPRLEPNVLVASKSQADTPTAATPAVASKYVRRELPEHYVKRAAAFELVLVDRDLPVIVLAADGTMASRKWVCALQESIDFITDEEAAAAAAAPPAGEASAADGGAGPSTPQPPQPKAVAPGTETRERSTACSRN